MLNIFTAENIHRDILYLIAAGPRPRCPEDIEKLRLRGAAAFAVCPMLGLPCVVPLSFLAEEPPDGLLREAAEALRGGLTVSGASFRVGFLYADVGPLKAWERASAVFSRLSLDSPFTESPGICLGPSSADPPPSLRPLRLRSLSVELYRLSSPDGLWETGLDWRVVRSVAVRKAGASQAPGRVI